MEDVINVYCVDTVNVINMENNKKITIGCLSPLTVIIFLAFFFAKIFDKIDWSWWWVFSPLWIPFAFLVVIIAIICLITLISFIVWLKL